MVSDNAPVWEHSAIIARPWRALSVPRSRYINTDARLGAPVGQRGVGRRQDRAPRVARFETRSCRRLPTAQTD